MLASGVVNRDWIIDTRITSHRERNQLWANDFRWVQGTDKYLASVCVPDVFKPYGWAPELRRGLHAAGRTVCRVAGKRPGDLHWTSEDYLRSMGEMKFFDQMTVHQHGSRYSGDDQSYTDDDIAAAIAGVTLLFRGQFIFLHAPTLQYPAIAFRKYPFRSGYKMGTEIPSSTAAERNILTWARELREKDRKGRGSSASVGVTQKIWWPGFCDAPQSPHLPAAGRPASSRKVRRLYRTWQRPQACYSGLDRSASFSLSLDYSAYDSSTPLPLLLIAITPVNTTGSRVPGNASL
jgi:hypothetical protein